MDIVLYIYCTQISGIFLYVLYSRVTRQQIMRTHIYYKHNISDIFACFILDSWLYAQLLNSLETIVDLYWMLPHTRTLLDYLQKYLFCVLYFIRLSQARTRCITRWPSAYTVTYYDKYQRAQSGEISSLRWWSISAIAITFRYDFPRLSRSVSRRTRAWPPGEQNTSSWTDRYFSFLF